MVVNFLTRVSLWYIKKFKPNFITNKLDGVFKKPNIIISVGKDREFPAPYFLPRRYCKTIFKLTVFKIADKDNVVKYYAREHKLFDVDIFGINITLYVGWPIYWKFTDLGWKDKYNSPRLEWSPAVNFYFFGWAYRLLIQAPYSSETFEDTYWEMVVWWLYYSEGDILEAEKTWGWTQTNKSGITESSWNNKFINLYDMEILKD